MLPRRQTLCAAAAGAAIFARIPDVLAATYDLIIKGGRVIDPGAGINAIRDVAIADGRIAAVGADLAADSAAEMIDARGKLVIPGMVDIHTHAGRAKELPPFSLPVMIHMGQTVSPLPKILDLLKRGDVVTHMYAPAPNGILDGSGQLLPDVAVARRRGIWFDYGNGRAGHVTWEVAGRALQQGFLPDTISTDWTPEGRAAQVIDLPNVMSKFLLLGLPLDQVIARVTG